MDFVEPPSDSLDTPPQGPVARFQHEHALGVEKLLVWEETAALKDLEAAIDHFVNASRTVHMGHPDHGKILQELGLAYYHRQYHHKTNAAERLPDIDRTIAYFRESLRVIPEGNPDRIMGFENLGVSYRDRFELCGFDYDVNKAVEYFHKALEMTALEASRSLMLQQIGNCYSQMYEISNAAEDLGHVITTLEKAVELDLEDVSMRSEQHEELSDAYSKRYKQTHQEADLELTIRHLTNSVNLTPSDSDLRLDRLRKLISFCVLENNQSPTPEHLDTSIVWLETYFNSTSFEEHPDRIRCGKLLGKLYLVKFNTTLEKSHVDKSLQLLQGVHDACNKDHLDWVDILYYLGRARLFSYQFSNASLDAVFNTIPDLDVTLELLQDAVENTPPHDPDYAERVGAIGLCFSLQYQNTRSSRHLELSITMNTKALDLTPRTDSLRRLHQYRLGESYMQKFDASREHLTLGKAIALFEDALSELPEHDPQWTTMAHSLGKALVARYGQQEDFADLQRAIETYEKVNEKKHFQPALVSGNLGLAYLGLYEHQKSTSNLDTAVQFLQNSVDQLSADHPLSAIATRHLGRSYMLRYWHFRNVDDLESALRLLQKALLMTQNDHESMAEQLTSLGEGYQSRYAISSAASDLDTATRLFQDAVDKTASDDPKYSTRLQLLGRAYTEEGSKKRALKPLDKGIELIHESFRSDYTKGVWARSRYLWRLGAAYKLRYDVSLRPEDINKAIQYARDDIAATPKGHYPTDESLYGLGISLYLRYHIHTESLDDLDEAIKYLQDAANAVQADDKREAPMIYYYLAQTLESRHSKKGDARDWEMSKEIMEESLSQPLYSPIQRLRSGLDLVRLLSGAEKDASAFRAATETLSLLPSVTSRSLQNSDKQDILRELDGLASDAAALALSTNHSAYDAIRLLESGRGVIVRTMTELRDDGTKLVQSYPDLAERLTKLGEQLDVQQSVADSFGELTSDTARIEQADRRHNASREFEDLIDEIRKKPGFKTYLAEPSETELMSAAHVAPVVIINVTYNRCDALIIEEDRFKALPLPDLYGVDVRDNFNMWKAGNMSMEEVLEWLWDTITHPVLQFLGFTTLPTDDAWPCVCWIPTGYLTKFPIHAAGYHHRPGDDTVLDRVISSYSSSIKALLQSQQSVSTTKEGHRPAAVLVGMSEIHQAPQEIQMLERICHRIQLDIRKPGHTRDEVLAALQNCSIFHFAGHGQANSSNPLRSSLILKGADRLTVEDLFKLDLHRTRPLLAYLSACGTGQVADNYMVDEGLHLIAAYQLAGFRHVIGTLWEVQDDQCVRVAAATYEWMARNMMSDRSITEGLHHACRSLRGQWLSDVSTVRSKTARSGKNVIREETKRTDESQGLEGPSERALRDIAVAEEMLLHWVPFVHFGG